jgi:hypothetical protein
MGQVLGLHLGPVMRDVIELLAVLLQTGEGWWARDCGRPWFPQVCILLVLTRVLLEQVMVAEDAVGRTLARGQSEQVHQAEGVEARGFFRAATTVGSTATVMRAGW